MLFEIKNGTLLFRPLELYPKEDDRLMDSLCSPMILLLVAIRGGLLAAVGEGVLEKYGSCLG